MQNKFCPQSADCLGVGGKSRGQVGRGLKCAPNRHHMAGCAAPSLQGGEEWKVKQGNCSLDIRIVFSADFIATSSSCHFTFCLHFCSSPSHRPPPPHPPSASSAPRVTGRFSWYSVPGQVRCEALIRFTD